MVANHVLLLLYDPHIGLVIYIHDIRCCKANVGEAYISKAVHLPLFFSKQTSLEAMVCYQKQLLLNSEYHSLLDVCICERETERKKEAVN